MEWAERGSVLGWTSENRIGSGMGGSWNIVVKMGRGKQKDKRWPSHLLLPTTSPSLSSSTSLCIDAPRPDACIWGLAGNLSLTSIPSALSSITQACRCTWHTVSRPQAWRFHVRGLH